MNTREELSDLITQLIFTCGPQHAAVNFPQYYYLAFTPNMPFAAYTAAPTDMSPGDENTLMDLLPPRNRASAQLLIISALTAFRTEPTAQTISPTLNPDRRLQSFKPNSKGLRPASTSATRRVSPITF